MANETHFCLTQIMKDRDCFLVVMEKCDRLAKNKSKLFLENESIIYYIIITITIK